MANQPQGKIFLYNYDAIQALGDEPICIALSPKTIALCLASVEYARWGKRWQSLTGTTIVNDTIEGITDNALSELMDESEKCMCCPEQAELLRQMIVLQNNAAAAGQAAQYNGEPSSMGDNIPANFDGGVETEQPDSQIDYALCKAISELMASGVQDAGNRLGIGGAAGAAMTAALWVINPILGLLAGIAWAITVETLENALEDTQAMKNVICCILKGVRGVAISQEALLGAVSNSGCELEGNEGTYQNIFETFISIEQNYIAWLAHFSSSLTLAENGVQDGNCECCESGGDLRLEYRWHYLEDYNNWVQSPSMYRDGNILHISCYHQNNNETLNDNEFGFRLYSPSGCCTRMRILNTSPTLTYGSGSYYTPIIQREGSRLECCGDSTNLDANNWFSTTDLKFRFAENGYTNPAWLYDIQIEIDPEYAGC